MILAALLGALVDRIVCGPVVGLNAAPLGSMISFIGLLYRAGKRFGFHFAERSISVYDRKMADGIKKVSYEIKGFSGVTGRTALDEDGMAIKHGNRPILQGGT